MQEIKEMSVQELKQMQDEAKDFRLLDVRNLDEYEYANIKADLIPMSEIPERYGEIEKDRPVIIHCHHGGRSKKVIAWLQQEYKYENLYNLTGGIQAWSEEIDTNVPIY